MDFRGHQNTGDRRVTNLFSEQDRLNTFHDWPQCAAVEPLALAKAGLYYLGQGDRVRCAFCMGTLKNWKHGDDPFVEHRTHFGNCPFVGGQNDRVGNIPLKPAESQPSPQAKRGTVPRKDDRVFEGGVVLNPRHPDYQSIDSRMASFVGWPPGVATQPSKMAEAGFYYCGHADNVCCFCCDGHLRNWEPEDDPWVEHARWFPRCAYVHQQKGSAYINDIQARKTAVQPSSTATAEALSEEQLKTSVVFKQVVDMGFGQDAVVSGLRQHMSTSGNQLPSLDHLISLLVGENSAIQPGTGEGAFLPSGPTSETVSAMGQRLEEGGISDRVLCKVCMDREVSVTFLPCGHLVCCAQCAQHVKQCPVCRKDVRASIRTYLC